MAADKIILKDPEIRLIVKRLAFQIAENNVNNAELLIVGLNDRGYFLAQLISKELTKILSSLRIDLFQYSLTESLVKVPESSNILVVDDVLNSGKTAFSAAAQCLGEKVTQLETAFLAVREYRSFPIRANYVGLSVATTLQNHVFFDNENQDDLIVFLK